MPVLQVFLLKMIFVDRVEMILARVGRLELKLIWETHQRDQKVSISVLTDNIHQENAQFIDNKMLCRLALTVLICC